MANRPQKTSPALVVAEERRQQAFWRNVVSYMLALYGPISVSEVPDLQGGILDVQAKSGTLHLSIIGQKRTLLLRIKSAWQVLIG
jgi:hypothetical protein